MGILLKTHQHFDFFKNACFKKCSFWARHNAAELRRKSGHGSAVDAIVVALAEPGGTVLTGDQGDIEKLATHANKVYVAAI